MADVKPEEAKLGVSSSPISYPPITPDMAEYAIRDQRIGELEAEVQKLKNQHLHLEEEIKLRDTKVAGLEAEIAIYSKDPRFRRVQGTPEEWRTSLWGCFQDTEICAKGLFCPCFLFGGTAATIMNWDDPPDQEIRGCFKVGRQAAAETAETTHQLFRCCTACTIHCTLGGCIQVISVWILGPLAALVTMAPCYAFEYRTRLRQHYNLKEGPFTDFCTSLICHPCALCQEAREIALREGGAERERVKKEIRAEVEAEMAKAKGKALEGEKAAATEPPKGQEMKK